jgi:putative transposase
MMPFWVCYYHVIWATKNRRPVITPEIETLILAVVRRKSTELDSPIMAVNGVDDHIHIAVSIPPKLAVTEWIQKIKGLSAYEVNAMFPDLAQTFTWQKGYGVLAFGATALERVVTYIDNQKLYHRDNHLEPYLERIDD